MAKLYIVGLLNEEPTPFDRQWVVEYDPTRPGVDAEGRPMIAHLITSPDPRDAQEFATVHEAEACWKQVYGVRKDGRPNRPLTAFVVEIQTGRQPAKARPQTQLHAERPMLAFIAEFNFS